MGSYQWPHFEWNTLPCCFEASRIAMNIKDETLETHSRKFKMRLWFHIQDGTLETHSRKSKMRHWSHIQDGTHRPDQVHTLP